MFVFQAMILPGVSPTDHLQADFTEEALGNFQGSKDKKTVQKQLKKLWKTGELVRTICKHFL